MDKKEEFIEKWLKCRKISRENLSKKMKEDLDQFENHIKEECANVLKKYETWEAKLILDTDCWEDGLPKFTQDLFEEWLEIQELRNKAIRKE